MSDQIPTQFPQYPVPGKDGKHQFAERKQVSPLFKMVKTMLKMPKTKVLQRRTRVAKRKFKII